MRFSRTKLTDVWVVDIEPIGDERGFFARAWCQREFAEVIGPVEFVQMNLAHSSQAGTLRGLHYQEHPYWEQKLVRCVRGSAFVVAVDLRPDSPTYRQWTGVELSSRNRRALYVGVGCAQGYQTLVDESELLYGMSTFYHPEAARGYRYDDPAFSIDWPRPVAVISDRDRAWSPYQPPQ